MKVTRCNHRRRIFVLLSFPPVPRQLFRDGFHDTPARQRTYVCCLRLNRPGKNAQKEDNTLSRDPTAPTTVEDAAETIASRYGKGPSSRQIF